MHIELLHQVLFVFGLSALLGGLIGLDKNLGNQVRQEKNIFSFASARSFAVIAFFGSLMCFIDEVLSTGIIFLCVGLAVVLFFVFFEFGIDTFRYGKSGPTTEMIAILIYFLGVLVFYGYFQIGIVVAIFLAFLIGSKDVILQAGKNISKTELKTSLKFAVIAFVILPLLPNPEQAYSIKDMLALAMPAKDLSGITNPILADLHFFHPYSIWKFVVVMSGISYLGYILTKFVDSKASILFSAFLGGTVSSTAVTASMTQKSKEDPANSASYTMGTLVASCVMFLRVIFVVAFLNFSLFQVLIFPLMLMFSGFLLMLGVFYYQTRKNTKPTQIEQNVRSPFRIAPALQFAGVLLLIKFLAGIGKVYDLAFLGELYYYIIALVSGLADVNGIMYAMSTDSLVGGTNSIELKVAAVAIIIAIISNNFVKGFLISYKMGEKTYGINVIKSFSLSIIMGIIGIILVFIF